MKFKLKAALAATLALIMALAVMPVSALPRFEAEAATTEKAVIEPYWTVPDGYNIHDYTKCVEFLEQMDDEGVKNGDKLGENYDPSNPGTWRTYCFQWTTVNGEQRLQALCFRGDLHEQLFGNLDVSGCTALEYLYCSFSNLSELDVSGCTALEYLYCCFNNLSELDVSGCTALEKLECYYNNLSELDVSGCTALEELECSSNNLSELDVSGCTALVRLYCYSNNFSELDVSGCTALVRLYCYYNNLSELDVSSNTALESLYCYSNNLSELDVSSNTALESLYCYSNNLSELDVTQNTALLNLYCYSNNLSVLDLSNNHDLAYDAILAEGDGLIGYYYNMVWNANKGTLFAYPVNGASLEGFYDETGVLISAGEWNDDYEAYIYAFEGQHTGTVIARFSGAAALPGDVDGNGSVSVADAITTLRLAMGLSDGSGMNTDAADMDGNGSITIADAIVILRTAMGLA